MEEGKEVRGKGKCWGKSRDEWGKGEGKGGGKVEVGRASDADGKITLGRGSRNFSVDRTPSFFRRPFYSGTS